MPRRAAEPDPVAQRFGAAVREAREQRKMTLEDLAGETRKRGGSLDPRYIGELELGWHSPTITTAQRLADALDLTLAQLVYDV